LRGRRKKIGTQSLAEGNAQININKKTGQSKVNFNMIWFEKLR
jgi:hypothetical protein